MHGLTQPGLQYLYDMRLQPPALCTLQQAETTPLQLKPKPSLVDQMCVLPLSFGLQGLTVLSKPSEAEVRRLAPSPTIIHVRLMAPWHRGTKVYLMKVLKRGP